MTIQVEPFTFPCQYPVRSWTRERGWFDHPCGTPLTLSQGVAYECDSWGESATFRHHHQPRRA